MSALYSRLWIWWWDLGWRIRFTVVQLVGRAGHVELADQLEVSLLEPHLDRIRARQAKLKAALLRARDRA